MRKGEFYPSAWNSHSPRQSLSFPWDLSYQQLTHEGTTSSTEAPCLQQGFGPQVWPHASHNPSQCRRTSVCPSSHSPALLDPIAPRFGLVFSWCIDTEIITNKKNPHSLFPGRLLQHKGTDIPMFQCQFSCVSGLTQKLQKMSKTLQLCLLLHSFLCPQEGVVDCPAKSNKMMEDPSYKEHSTWP